MKVESKDLTLAIIEDSGYEILDWRYTGVSLTYIPQVDK